MDEKIDRAVEELSKALREHGRDSVEFRSSFNNLADLMREQRSHFTLEIQDSTVGSKSSFEVKHG